MRKAKLADRIAREIEDSIVAGRWSSGTPLGNEAAIVAERGVSRWTVREAVRMLEVDGLVESRRGGGGGLFVGAPVADFVASRLAHYLEFVGIDADEIGEVWNRVGPALILDAAPHLEPADLEELAALAIPAEGEELGVGFNRVRRIDDVISRRSGNPALVLAAAVISQLALHAGWYSTLDDEAYEALFPPLISHFQDSAAALARGDVDEAAEAFRDYTTASLPLIRSSPLIERASVRPGAIERAYRIYPGIRPVKKADMVTGALRDMIFEAGWPVGLNIGTEPELMARFGVGRAVLREATRALERVGVVRTSRGAAGGLIVAEPDPAAVIDCCHRHLRREGTTPANLAEVRALVAACTGTRLKPLLLTAMDIDNS